jgi:hypothetical protein
MDIDSSQYAPRSSSSRPAEDAQAADDRSDWRPCQPGQQVQLVVGDARTTARVVRVCPEKVYVEGALLEGKYFAGWVPAEALTVYESE